MPIYQYAAVSDSGKKIEGMIEADSFENAKEKLRKQHILVVRLAQEKRQKNSFKLSSAALLDFTRDLSGLLAAKLPLYESLLAVEEKYSGTKSQAIFLRICESVKQGTSLSSALEEFPKAFDQIYISMVAAGEETGSLPQVFEELSKLLTKSQKIKKQTMTAMIYPGFLLGFCCIVLVALFFFLIPSMEELFEGRTLHPLTQAILNISHFFKKNGTLFLAGTIGFLSLLIAYLRSSKGKAFVKVHSLKLPLVRAILIETVMARFSRVLAVLLKSGVPMLKALPLAKKVMNHPSFEELISKVEKKLIEGQPLSSELKKSSLMPKMVVRMLSISEETGEVGQMLLSIAVIYEENLEKYLGRITQLLQPAILLFLGFVVGIVLLAVLLPLTDVSSFVQ